MDYQYGGYRYGGRVTLRTLKPYTSYVVVLGLGMILRGTMLQHQDTGVYEAGITTS